MDCSGSGERLWRTFNADCEAAVINLNEPVITSIKQEPEEEEEMRWTTPPEQRTEQGKEKLNDNDLYLTEFIKVEALISPRYTKKFLIPIDIPYTESTVRRRKSATGQQLTQSQSNIGKIKMRKITDLQRPEAPQRISPDMMAWHGRRISANHLRNMSYPPTPTCFCNNCLRNHTGNYSLSSTRPCQPYPRLPELDRTNLWRPFI